MARQRTVPDDKFLVDTTSDITGGINNRVNDSQINVNQAKTLTNVDLSQPGKNVTVPGSVAIANDVGDDGCVQLTNFVIQGATDQLLLYEGTNLRKWEGSGNWSAAIKSDFTASMTDVGIIGAKVSGITPDAVAIVQNGTDNAQQINANGTVTDLGDTNTSPPKTTVMAWFGNRVWCLKNDGASYSDAVPTTNYATAFDRTTNVFRIPVGEERAIVPTRDTGLIFFGKQAVWGLAPSVVPAVTDKPEPLITNVGCAAKNTVVRVGDDIMWLAQDGVRSLKRTVQDKLQIGDGYPLSYALKDEFDTINWAAIDKACAVYFDNKYMLALPVDGSLTNNVVWIYYTATNGWSTRTGWSVGCWEVYKVNGEDRLYYGDASDGQVYRAWTGTDDNGSDIAYEYETRQYNLNLPYQMKFGGVLDLRCEDGGGVITISYSLDDNDYVLLGTLDTAGDSGITFPTTFPAIFGEIGVIRGKFHLDKIMERWTGIQFKFTNTSTDPIRILDHTLLTHSDEYEEE